ncbi:MAG: type II toxin-antitoxin system Phd/YefM family antitoxin [Trueperaceae bacterium]|nr:MAG: type II toxin-antitoxin system Phd/YefM family antitoxin [Trueperaceae bacterium]
MAWQIQEAKQKFSELIKRAHQEGPQVVTRHGEEVAVVVSAETYRRLSGSAKDFKAFLLSGPDLGELDIQRSTEPARTIDL